LKEFYKTHPVEFIMDWGMTVDPRNLEIGKSATVPFLLFPKQQEFINWIYARWQNREGGLAEKSRDAGLSWMCVAFAVWMWLFHDGSAIGFGSRKEEYVDKIGDPKSLFWKVRQFINYLPIEFKPKGYDEGKHAPGMRILNPENGSSIIGEAGDNIGRGARASIYIVDEAAFLERPEATDAALSQTTNCRIDVSTPNGTGNSFFRKRNSGAVSVFSMNWRDDPRKDDVWYQKQLKTLTPMVVAQEIDIDYAASIEGGFINAESIIAGQQTKPDSIEAIGGWIIGIDAAHSESKGADESVICMRKGRLTLPLVTARGLDGYALSGLVMSQITKLQGEIAGIVIELDGPGVSCFDFLKRTKYAALVYGVHTGKKLKDGRHYNLRALLWARAKEYLENAPISLPTDGEFRSQGCSMLCSFPDGLLLMQDKKAFKKDYGCSPDRFDSFVLTFFDVEGSFRRKMQQPIKVHLGYENRKRIGR
jgi:hypothetical protein